MTYLSPLVPPQESAIREWERLMRQIGALAEAAVDATARPERLWQVNGTAHGANVGDCGYTREAAKAAREFVQAFLAWSQTPIIVDQLEDGTPIQMSPMAIITLR
jgi:hypothetical protein